jgi:hypothetical protein
MKIRQKHRRKSKEQAHMVSVDLLGEKSLFERLRREKKVRNRPFLL